MSYFIVRSGARVYPDEIDGFKINLQDIAHHLSKIQRFGGCLPLGVHYSVASHSVYLAHYTYRKLGPMAARAALMHDASEAYLGDVLSPLKHCLDDYMDLEAQLQERINRHYKLATNPRIHALIGDFDKRIVLDESRALLPRFENEFYCDGLTPLGINISPDDTERGSFRNFLEACEKLNISDGEGK